MLHHPFKTHGIGVHGILLIRTAEDGGRGGEDDAAVSSGEHAREHRLYHNDGAQVVDIHRLAKDRHVLVEEKA